MASAAILRSAACSLRLRRPLDRQGCLLARRSVEDLSPTTRLLSSSVPTEEEQKRKVQEKTGDIYQRLSMKIDRLSEGVDETSMLLKQVKAQIKENKKHAGPIDLTPWLVSSFGFLLPLQLYAGLISSGK